MSLLKRLFSGKPKAVPFIAELAPDTPFYVIGDVHGRMDLLDRLLTKIDAEDGALGVPLVFVGDYIDRGEQSAQVLRHVHALSQSAGRQVICLTGNHEDMLLKFLEDPAERGARWLRYGGLQTLFSFDVGAISDQSTDGAMEQARNALEDAMGPEMIKWLEDMPTSWQTGNVAVVHAAADPAEPIATQSPRILKWGHPDFHHKARSDGTWVVHGHTIVDEANATDGRIATDTGAFATGKLTAAYIEPGNLRFIQA
ncbi:metallophosphoesterase [Tropicibacter sp. Alg240-R139]|uniref:metallophosphoesterase n=1 Tax=Tropicibacter sp. Alg240-R139 TaxID=2305991 RepID=UPI0013DFD161|nr:metallophosphoesterase [Tropicibacter sp. Alg240-R139]